MRTNDLRHLPELIEACDEAGMTSVTVCTLPPDLRLAPIAEGVALVERLMRAVKVLLPDASMSLVGRRFYLPSSLVEAVAATSRDERVQVRLAVDYACRPSLLGPDEAYLLLLPRGHVEGNLLAWQFARAERLEVDWRRFDGGELFDYLHRRAGHPRLFAAR